MKSIVLGTTALVLSATFAMAAGHSVVRMGTERLPSLQLH